MGCGHRGTQGHAVTYAMIGDPTLEVAKLYNVLPADAGDASEGPTAANNATVRNFEGRGRHNCSRSVGRRSEAEISWRVEDGETLSPRGG